MRPRSGGRGKTAAAFVGRRAPTLASFWIKALSATASVVALALLCGAILWVRAEARHDAEQARYFGALLAQELGGRATALQQRLTEWSADPRIRKALREASAESLAAGQSLLADRLPEALSIRLLLPGEEPRDGGGAASLSYAGLDLVHQAGRQRKVTPLEVHWVGADDVHLAMAAPALDNEGEELLGILYLSLPIALLPATGLADEARPVQIRYQQRAGGAVATVDPQRFGRPPRGDPDHRLDVAGTRLQVVAWVPRAGLHEGALPALLVGGFAAVMALISLLSWLTLRDLRAALATDLSGLVAMTEDAQHQRPIRRIRCRLAECQAVAEVLGRILRDLERPRQGQRRLAPHAAPELLPGPTRGSARDTSRRAEAGAGTPATGAQPPASAAPDAVPGASGLLAEQLDLQELEVDETAAGDISAAEADAAPGDVPTHIFRAYDIRGIIGDDLTAALSRRIGRAVGSEARDSGGTRVFVARDTRPSSEELSEGLVDGLRASGCEVIDLGLAPTPLLYFATRFDGNAAGVMVTGSHNPPEYNGFKVVIAGVSLEGEGIASLRRRILDGRLANGAGSYRQLDLAETYIARVEKDVALARAVRLVVDCGNGAASVLAGDLYRALGCEVSEIDCDPRSGFPGGRAPDPTREECLEALRRRVVAEGAELGLAFDGDGDRLGVVDSSGKIIWTDRVLMLLAADVLSRHPGTDVIFDVKSSHLLAQEIRRNGGRPLMWRSGHSPLKAKLAEKGALLAGEWSGHIIFQERWYGFDDALYAGARLLEVLAPDPRASAEVFAGLPEAISTPELFLPMAEGDSDRVVAAVVALADELEGVDAHKIDGLRIEQEHGWGLVRTSNTQPALVFRFEADDEPSLQQVQGLFRGLIQRAAPDLELPF